MEVIAPVVALFALISIAALVFGTAIWLILFTPIVRWTFYALVTFLCLRLVLLPFQTGSRVLEEGASLEGGRGVHDELWAGSALRRIRAERDRHDHQPIGPLDPSDLHRLPCPEARVRFL